MTLTRKTYLAVCIGLMLALAGSFVTADAINYIFRASFHIFYPYWPKLVLSFLVALIAWTLGAAGLNTKDTRFIKLYSLLIFPGDICMFLVALWDGKNSAKTALVIGYCLFVAAHIIMDIRLFPWIKGAPRFNSDGFPWWTIAVVFIPASVLFVLLVPALAHQGLFWAGLIYNYCVAFTLWLSLLAWWAKVLPKTNRQLIFSGYIAFYLCEALGGVFNAYPGSDTALFVLIFIWLFYAPAILFSALSGLAWRSA